MKDTTYERSLKAVAKSGEPAVFYTAGTIEGSGEVVCLKTTVQHTLSCECSVCRAREAGRKAKLEHLVELVTGKTKL